MRCPSPKPLPEIPVRLEAGLTDQKRYHELLAILDAQSDVSEKTNAATVRRKIKGTVLERGPIWDDFLAFWGRDGIMVDDVPHMTISLIQVDYEFYHMFSYLHVDENLVSLVVDEQWNDSLKEYHAHFQRRRNTLVGQLGKWDRGEITPNDLRELLGRTPFDTPYHNRPIPADNLPGLREQCFREGGRQPIRINVY
jgi:hypothetical protein